MKRKSFQTCSRSFIISIINWLIDIWDIYKRYINNGGQKKSLIRRLASLSCQYVSTSISWSILTYLATRKPKKDPLDIYIYMIMTTQSDMIYVDSYKLASRSRSSQSQILCSITMVYRFVVFLFVIELDTRY